MLSQRVLSRSREDPEVVLVIREYNVIAVVSQIEGEVLRGVVLAERGETDGECCVCVGGEHADGREEYVTEEV